ncbi:hypothetical protein V6N12_059229 [Hibiscus sabdariffa]|uniref:Uncharacterized protein n=1 Tax=Hibiscus sabdariffa TaxID=183260 RepID=A0ABR2EUF1_9ROSI
MSSAKEIVLDTLFLLVPSSHECVMGNAGLRHHQAADLDHVARWVEELRAHADNSIVIMLIGNKADLVDHRAVPTEDAVEFAEDQGLFFAETSALSGDNVDKAFFKLLEEICVVMCRKSLECSSGKLNGVDQATALKGSKIEVIAGPDLEISEMKKLSACSC